MENLEDLGQKILKLEDLPEGALTRYIRDVYAMGGSDLSFEDFQEQWKKEDAERGRVRNIEHPIELDKTIKIDEYKSVHFFKRRGEDWMCSECDMAPNGGCGWLTLAEALKMSGKSDVSELF